ncbi:hypothetical protein [uncultured Gimesia sp.]|uniref:hypothetical protein n=1 Tax=uncultured Gimesia sp. TaxID=1678688 RepID=UPI0030D86F87
MNGYKKQFTKYLSLFGLLLFLVQPLEATEWGDLSGQFIYTGKPPDSQKLKRLKDQSFVIGENGGIKNICIFLREEKSQNFKIHSSYDELPKTVFLSHQNSTYEPHVSGLWYERQQLICINKDPHAHRIHLFPFKNYFPDKLPKEINNQRTFRFQTHERLPFQIKCDMHPWETAYLMVLAHPYFTSTDETGAFTIKNLPVGDCEFRIWHESIGYVEAKEEWKRGSIKIKIKPGKNDLGVIKVSPKLVEKK